MKLLIKCQFTWCVGVQSVQKNAFEENTSGNSLKSLFVSNRQHYLSEMSSRGVEGIVDSALRGGGGALSIYTGGGVPRHIQKGGLRHGHSPNKGGLRHGHNPKKGGLRHGHESKKGDLRHGHESKKGVLRTGLVRKTILVTDVAQNGVLGAYLLITLAFFLST